MPATNLQVLLARRPSGWVQETDFELHEAAIPTPGPGEFLVRNLYLSLDPYMRAAMNDSRSYAPGVALGDVMIGGTVGEVLESRHPGFQVGDTVTAYLGWQRYGLSDGSGLVRKVDPTRVPLSTYLGVAGMPGVTAWIGLLDIGQPKSGETVVVSAAAGAVGSVVGQLAKLHGCRAVGIAGGKPKCDHVVNELGFDACIDYKAGNLIAELREATPSGVDIYFDNVGGELLDAVLTRLNRSARIPLCGLISQYNETDPRGIRNVASLLVNRVRLQGFIVSDHLDRWPEALDQLTRWVAEGKLQYRETITDGLENAPRAFVGLFHGQNLGKQLVKLT